MRHFLRGRTGANSVLNKGQDFGSISVHTQHHRYIHFTHHTGVQRFPSSSSLLSSPTVFYKSDIINQTFAEAHSHFTKIKRSKGSNTKVAGQVWKSGDLGWSESEERNLM